MKRVYPCQVFILGAHSFIVRKITLTRPYRPDSDAFGAYTKAGKFYSDREIHVTKDAAIKFGRTQLKRRKKSLEAGLELVVKQTAALDKVEKGGAQ